MPEFKLEARPKPYFWVTWLAKLLAGESECPWPTWMRMTYWKVDATSGFSDARRADYSRRHRQLLEMDLDALPKRGRYLIESQNHFTVVGAAASIGGKPDAVWVDEEDGGATPEDKEIDGIVREYKTGRAKASDIIQAQLYLALLPFTPQWKGRRIRWRAEVIYGSVPEGKTTIEIAERVPVELAADFAEHAFGEIRRLAAQSEPRRRPSQSACRYCDMNCPERSVKQTEPELD